jgi:hypothetical protein
LLKGAGSLTGQNPRLVFGRFRKVPLPFFFPYLVVVA